MSKKATIKIDITRDENNLYEGIHTQIDASVMDAILAAISLFEFAIKESNKEYPDRQLADFISEVINNGAGIMMLLKKLHDKGAKSEDK